MPTLRHVPGDPSAAKAAVAAALSTGLDRLKLEQSSLTKSPASAALSLALPGGGALTDGNAAARYIGVFNRPSLLQLYSLPPSHPPPPTPGLAML